MRLSITGQLSFVWRRQQEERPKKWQGDGLLGNFGDYGYSMVLNIQTCSKCVMVRTELFGDGQYPCGWCTSLYVHHGFCPSFCVLCIYPAGKLRMTNSKNPFASGTRWGWWDLKPCWHRKQGNHQGCTKDYQLQQVKQVLMVLLQWGGLGVCNPKPIIQNLIVCLKEVWNQGIPENWPQFRCVLYSATHPGLDLWI